MKADEWYQKVRQFWYMSINDIYWKLPFGAVIVLNWPTVPSSDPNECWRGYLEEHAGIQGIHWDWKLWECGVFDDVSKIGVKFMRKKDAVMFALIYGSC